MKKNTKDKVLNYVLITLAIVTVCIVLFAVLFSRYVNNKKTEYRKEIVQQFHQELEVKLKELDGNNGCEFNGETIYVRVPSQFYTGTDSEKKYYCTSYQDAITAVRNQHDDLIDGYYQPVYFIDDTRRTLAYCNMNGNCKLE